MTFYSRLSMTLSGFSFPLALFIALSGPSAGAAVLCVNPSGTAGCHATISAAVTAAQSGDLVRVAEGSYTENVTIAKTITLEGGWNASFTVRSPATTPSIVQPANDVDSVVSLRGPFGGPATSPVLDGFTITGGRGDVGFYHGGGMNLRDTDATVRGCTISGNVGYLLGGGVWVQRGAPRLEGNLITGNHAFGTISVGGGGGVYLENADAVLVGNTITNNVLDGSGETGGGGVGVASGTVTIRGGIIRNNTVTADGGPGLGGGLRVQFASRVEVTDVEFSGNDPGNGGSGGLGGAVYLDFNDDFTLANLLVRDNFGPETGGVAVKRSGDNPGILVNSTLLNNEGEGVRVFDFGALTLTNSIVAGHTVGLTLISGTATATFNDFLNNTTDAIGLSLDASNLTVDPLLTPEFRLAPGSLLIDAGTAAGAPNHDRDGDPRPMAGPGGLFRFDIGSDEATGRPQLVHRLAEEPADLTVYGPGNPVDNPDSTGSSDWIGFAVALGDVNSDGIDDLITGAPNHSDDFDGSGTGSVVADSGRAYALFGSTTRRPAVHDMLVQGADLEVRSWMHQQHVGQSFAVADLDGDAASDLVVGSSGGTSGSGDPIPGAAYGFAGSPGIVGVQELFPVRDDDWRFLGLFNFGFAYANALAAGQLDGSGPRDLAIGDALASGPGNRLEAGAVYVFRGRANLPATWNLATTPADTTVYGAAAGDGLGLVAVGDVNDDGDLDLVARGPASAHILYGPVALGVRDLAIGPADATITGLAQGPLAVADIDGDGPADLVLGNGNQVVVVRGGGLSGTAAVGDVAWGRLTELAAGAFAVLDHDGDDRPDLALGDPTGDRTLLVLDSNGLAGTARAQERADVIVLGAQPGDQLGFSLAAGDFDHDTALDLAIGTRDHELVERDPELEDAGAVYLFYGRSPLIFSDGFESGDTSAWSSAVAGLTGMSSM